MTFSDYVVYADESGDSSLRSIDPNYPVFAVAFCIFHKDAYVNDVVPAVLSLKFDYFGHESVVWHGYEIGRRQPPFGFDGDHARHAAFIDDLTAVLRQAPFTVVAAVINKAKLAARERSVHAPVELTMRFCVERLYSFLLDSGQLGRQTRIIAEQRGGGDDRRMHQAFERVIGGRNRHGRIDDLTLISAPKLSNLTGLQIADLITQPIARRAIYPSRRNRAFDAIKNKLRRGSRLDPLGRGLIIYPR